MAHVRKQLRDEVKARLAGLGSLGLTVFTDDEPMHDEAQLPVGYVLTRTETSSRANKSGTMQRELEVVVAVEFATAPETIDDEADVFAEAIEADLDANPPSQAMYFDLTDTEIESFSDEEGEQWYGALALVYRAMLFTPKSDPSTTAN